MKEHKAQSYALKSDGKESDTVNEGASEAKQVVFAATGERREFDFRQRSRRYRIHVPTGVASSQRVPLVLFLHGGGTNARAASRLGMSALADEHGFIVVYPDAIDRRWNDGRVCDAYREHDADVDDVAFIDELLIRLRAQYDIDRERIFAAGASNGGFMVQRLGIELSEHFAAIGVLIATLPEPLLDVFAPAEPVSAVFVNGTEDPIVPYHGGDVVTRPQFSLKATSTARGRCTSTGIAVNLWRQRNGLADRTAETQRIARQQPYNDTHVERSFWSGGERGTCVALYRVVGGGHTIPGGLQYSSEEVIGRTNHDIDGLKVVWGFFAHSARQPQHS